MVSQSVPNLALSPITVPFTFSFVATSFVQLAVPGRIQACSYLQGLNLPFARNSPSPDSHMTAAHVPQVSAQTLPSQQGKDP